MVIEVLDRKLDLKKGSHSNIEDGACIMEVVSFVAGEPFSDHPACASKVIGAFLRAWNDSLPTDADRNRLLGPLVQRLVGTAGTPEVETKRAWMALDWSIRVSVPTWMAMTPVLKPHAKKLNALGEITDKASWAKAEPILVAAWDAAWDAARKKLAPTVKKLQASALKLISRMIECKS